MSVFECHNCGEDSCNEPVVQILLTHNALNSNYKMLGNFTIFHSGWAYKPGGVSDEEWRKIVQMESDEYHKLRNEILIHNIQSFCCLKCAIEFLEKEGIR
jgi:hypothetical protein